MNGKHPIHVLLLALATAHPVLAETWEIDPNHSTVGFGVRHLMISTVKGAFKKFSGSIDMDEKAPASAAVNVEIDVASIDTGVQKRDDHLRSADFFDVQKFPAMTFKSTKVEGDGNKAKVTGDLTLHGVTKPVTLDVEKTAAVKDPWGNTRTGFTANGKLSRQEFGMTWNKALEAGGVVVSDEVSINIEVEATRKEPGSASPAPSAAPASPAGR